MKRCFCVILSFLFLFCGCTKNEPSVGSFSYANDRAYYDGDSGVKQSDFVNTEKSEVKNAEKAVELAKKECTVEYNTFTVDFDADAKIYRVCFFMKDLPGGDQSVYINQEGITELIVYGE